MDEHSLLAPRASRHFTNAHAHTHTVRHLFFFWNDAWPCDTELHLLPCFRCFRRTDVTDLKATSNATKTEEEESTLPLA